MSCLVEIESSKKVEEEHLDKNIESDDFPWLCSRTKG